MYCRFNLRILCQYVLLFLEFLHLSQQECGLLIDIMCLLSKMSLVGYTINRLYLPFYNEIRNIIREGF